MKKIFKLTLGLVAVGYVPFAPVFTTSQYGTQAMAEFSDGAGYSYLWITRESSFLYFLVCGRWDYEIRNAARLMVRDEEGAVTQVIIEDAIVMIDGTKFSVAELENARIEMNRGQFNMYGGSGGSGIVKFQLPIIPKTAVQVDLHGKTVDTSGDESIFSIMVTSDITEDAEVIPMFAYFFRYWHL